MKGRVVVVTGASAGIGAALAEVCASKAALVVLVVLALCATGCGGVQSELRTRASYDMNCPRGELRIKKFPDGKMYVSGCGVDKTYSQQCLGAKGTPDYKCEWIMD